MHIARRCFVFIRHFGKESTRVVEDEIGTKNVGGRVTWLFVYPKYLGRELTLGLNLSHNIVLATSGKS